MTITLEENKNVVVSVELDGETVPALQTALAEECVERFYTNSARGKLVFGFLADVEFALRKIIKK